MNIRCVKKYLSSMQQRSWRFFFYDRGKRNNHFSITNLLSTAYNKTFLEPVSSSKNFLSDCNTRPTSIKQAERSKSMTECICRPERGDISGSSARDTPASVLSRNPAASVFHSVICSQARLSPSTSTSVFVRVDSSITESLRGHSSQRTHVDRISSEKTWVSPKQSDPKWTELRVIKLQQR